MRNFDTVYINNIRQQLYKLLAAWLRKDLWRTFNNAIKSLQGRNTQPKEPPNQKERMDTDKSKIKIKKQRSQNKKKTNLLTYFNGYDVITNKEKEIKY